MWQFLQNIIGFIFIKITNAQRSLKVVEDKTFDVYIARRFNSKWSGVSLGNYIVFAYNRYADDDSIRHEYGHQIQSKRLGPLYLFIVGLPSFIRNIYDRIAHKNWTYEERVKWYYGGWPEKQADKYGGVHRLRSE